MLLRIIATKRQAKDCNLIQQQKEKEFKYQALVTTKTKKSISKGTSPSK